MGVIEGALRGVQQAKTNKQEKANWTDTEAKIQDYLKQYGNFQGGLGSYFGYNPQTGAFNPTGAGAGMFGPQTTTQEGRSYGSSDVNELTRPEVAAENLGLEQQLRTEMENKLRRGSALPPGYEQMLMRGAVENAKPQEQMLRNEAAKRGVSAESMMLGSPVEAQRAAAMGDITAQMPLLERRLRNEDVGAAGAFAQSRLGSRHTGRTNTSNNTFGTSTGPANYGAIMQLMQGLAPHDPIIHEKQIQQNPWLTGITGAASGGLQDAMSVMSMGKKAGAAGATGGASGKFG